MINDEVTDLLIYGMVSAPVSVAAWLNKLVNHIMNLWKCSWWPVIILNSLCTDGQGAPSARLHLCEPSEASGERTAGLSTLSWISEVSRPSLSSSSVWLHIKQGMTIYSPKSSYVTVLSVQGKIQHSRQWTKSICMKVLKMIMPMSSGMPGWIQCDLIIHLSMNISRINETHKH